MCKKPSNIHLKWLYHFVLPPAMSESSIAPHSCYLPFGHSNRCVGYLIDNLIYISLIMYDVEHLLIWLFSHLYIFFGKVFVNVFGPFFKSDCLIFFCCWVFSLVQLLSHVWLFVTLWTAACILPFLLFFFWPCCTANRILVPWPGVEPESPAVEAWSLTHWTAS